MKLPLFCITSISILFFSFPLYASEKPRIQGYLGGKFMVGSAGLSVGKYTTINNPHAPAKEGKEAGKATQTHWGGGAVFGIKIPLIPLLALRTEIEYTRGRAAKTFAQGGETKLGFNTNNTLLNIALDFTSLHPIIKPYISYGLGVGVNELKYTPASIEVGAITADPTNFITQVGIGTYFLLGSVALDLNIRYLYNGSVQKTYVNTNGDAYRRFKAAPHMVESYLSLLVFL